MHYFIDGYNLMFQILQAGDDFKTQRENFVKSLNEKIQFLNLDVTIVFDAQYQLGEGSRAHFNNMEICFTDQGETADDYIIRAIKLSTKPRQETVVTSDGRLSWHARRLSAHSESVTQFLRWLNKRYTNRLSKIDSGKNAPKKIIPPIKIVSKEYAPSVDLPPKPGKSIEESFDYYLFEFEKNFRELIKEEKKPKDLGRSSETDMERWLRLFEQNKNGDTEPPL